jgi:drug/metabolite transporter (DMT)-like permease
VEEKKPAGKTAILLGMLGIIFGWGTTYIATHYALMVIPAWLMSGFRNLLAGVLLYAFQRLNGAKPPTLQMWKSACVVGLIMICAGSGLNVWAQGIVPSGISSLLIGSIPLWMTLLDLAVSKHAKVPGPGKIAVAGILFGFLGIVLLIGPMNIMGTRIVLNPLGVAALLIGSFFWAAGSLKSRSAVFPSSRVLGSGMQMITGGIGLLVVSVLIGEPARFSPAEMTTTSILSFAYLVTVGSLFSFAVYTWLLGVAPLPLVSTYAYVNPVVAIVLGALILDEVVSLRLVIASAMILVAVAVVILSSGAKPRPSSQSRPDSK